MLFWCVSVFVRVRVRPSRRLAGTGGVLVAVLVLLGKEEPDLDNSKEIVMFSLV